MPVRAVLIAAALAAGAAPLAGQALPPASGPHDRAVPRPAEVRGFPTGAGFTAPADVVRVLERIAATSRRVVLERYGHTAEGRPLLLAWISSPGNLARLAELKAANVSLAFSEGDTRQAKGRPLFVWLAFGVHGDEPAGPEAALELAYHLAASRDPSVRKMLERLVVVVDPLQNPDGHARYLRWYRSVAGPLPDPRPRVAEHDPAWPSGRTNGLYFDLNRDWAWGLMPETRARWKAYLGTLPQVLVDFHEMDPGSSYFFFPPAEPVHPLLPASTLAWARIFGEANGQAFERRGWDWYSGRDFDLLYPGYGDAWSSFHGATGMTYEQAGGGRAGRALARPGGVLTLEERVEHHLQAALATLEAASDRSRQRLGDFARFWGPERTPPAGVPMSYLLPPAPGVEELARLLVAQGVRVGATVSPAAARRLTARGADGPVERLPAGTLAVATDQPFGRYAAALLDPRPVAGRTTSDISAWALPLLFDVPAFVPAGGEAPALGEWRAGAARPALPAGTAALAWTYGSLADPLGAIRLASRGARVQVAERPFVAGGRVWPRGTFVHPVSRAPASRARRVAAELAALGIAVRPLPAPVEGPFLRPLRVPRVAVVGGEPVLETSLGAVLHLLARAGVDADTLSAEGLAGPGLTRYDVVVLPDGVEVARYAARLRPARRELRRWVEGGGTLVAVRGGAAALAVAGRTGADLTSARRAERTGSGRAADLVQGAPGVLMAARVDPSDVLGHGFPDGEATVMAWDPVLLDRSEGDAAWRFAGAQPEAGLLPGGAARELAGRPYAVSRARGRGREVLFADDPGFRGILPALGKLYLNALVLLPGRPGEGASAGL